MKNSCIIFMLFACLFLLNVNRCEQHAVNIDSQTHFLYISPENLDDEDDATPSTMFTYDWDQEKPKASSAEGGAPGFGESAFWSDVQGSAAGGGRDYTAVRMIPQNIFHTGKFFLKDFGGISYWTKHFSGPDWQIKIYTWPRDGQQEGWYAYRFNIERPQPIDNEWHEYSTDDLKVEWIRDGETGENIYPTNMTVSDLVNHPKYSKEAITVIDVCAGYATNSPAVDSYLDGMVIHAKNNWVALVNFMEDGEVVENDKKDK